MPQAMSTRCPASPFRIHCTAAAMVLRKFWHGLVIPRVQILRSPGKGLIKMTKVAGIRPPIGEAFLHGWRGDLMAAHRVKQSERGARHMAIVTTAAGRVRAMMRMRNESCAQIFVTLQTGSVRIHFRF